jgi:NAD(P)-dependent dehydrogenase (short-subunit alcohol dehydrogenase family)
MTIFDELFSLKGRTALVTGGGTGLGKEFALTLAAAGADVILAARRIDKLHETAAMIKQRGGHASVVPLDVTDPGSVQALFETRAPHTVIDILINNAGIIGTPSLLDMSEEEWQRIVDTNLTGSWRVAREFTARLIAKKQPGSIINIASLLAVAAQKGTGPYAASKAGLIQLTRSMAIEWARYGITANAIMPGYIATDIAEDFLHTEAGQQMQKRIPLRRLGKPQDLRGVILLLASAASSYMTGSVITVDGGHSLPQPL